MAEKTTHKKFGGRLGLTRILDGHSKLKYCPQQPVECYIYNHVHYYETIGDLGDTKDYKRFILDEDLRNDTNLEDNLHEAIFLAGRNYQRNLVCMISIISRLPAALREKFDDLKVEDITIDKIDRIIEIFRIRHPSRDVTSPRVNNGNSNSKDGPEAAAKKSLKVEILNNKKKSTNKKNGILKFNQNLICGGQNKGAVKKSPFCLYCKKDGHIQNDCFRRKRDNAPCFSQKGKPYYPRYENP